MITFVPNNDPKLNVNLLQSGPEICKSYVKMDEGLGWMVEEMGREELLEEVQRLKVMVS